MLTSRERPAPATRVSARVLARCAATLLLLSNEETDAEATAEEGTGLSKQGQEKATTIFENNFENNSYFNPPCRQQQQLVHLLLDPVLMDTRGRSARVQEYPRISTSL